MDNLSNGLVPVVVTTFIILLFILIIGLVDKILRHEALEVYKESLKNFRVVRVFKMDLVHTSIYSLSLSLIRFNILFYLIIKTIGNMLYGSDVLLFELNYIISFIVVFEFLFFLKTKKRNEINELSTLPLVIIIMLTLIGIAKMSTNLIIERPIFWLMDGGYFSNWTILEYPLLLIPMFYILISLYARIIKSSVALKYNTLDRFFDYLSNNLLYIYLACFFLRSVMGGVIDIRISSSSETILVESLISILIKFSLITLVTRLLIRFLPSVIDLRGKNLVPLSIVIILNITLVYLAKGVM